MSFEINQTVNLGENRYTILKSLGSGAVSSVYLASPVSHAEIEVILKVVRADARDDADKVAGVRKEAAVLQALNRAEGLTWSASAPLTERLRQTQTKFTGRHIIALLDHGELNTGQPCLVQEKARQPFARFDINTLADERRMIAIAEAIANAIALTHQQNLALKDFDPRGYKEDRLYLETDADPAELKIIDWNVTGGPADMAQDLLFFGMHLYYFMLGRRLTLDEEDRPPVNLGVGMQEWGRLTEGTRLIIQRLLHREPERRYPHAAGLQADLAWWHNALDQVDTTSVFRRLNDRLNRARAEGRYDRVLAASGLALHLNPPPQEQQSFQVWYTQARNELEKADWQPIAQARTFLMTGAFSSAAESFASQVRILPREGNAARLARVYQHLAEAGQLFKMLKKDTGSLPRVRETLEWKNLQSAAEALVADEPEKAKVHLTQIPETAEWEPVIALHKLAEAGLIFEAAATLRNKAAPDEAAAQSANWVETERQQVALLEQAVSQFGKAYQLAPDEPKYESQYKLERAYLEKRTGFLQQYESAETFARNAEEAIDSAKLQNESGKYAEASKNFQSAKENYQNVLTALQTVLNDDPEQYRALFLKRRYEPLFTTAETEAQTAARKAKQLEKEQAVLDAAKRHLEEGRYAEALAALDKIANDELLSGYAAYSTLREQAETGQARTAQAHSALTLARQHLARGDFEAAQEVAQLDEIGVFDEETRRQQNTLRQEIRERQPAHAQVQSFRTEADWQAVVDVLSRLHTRYAPLPQEILWVDEAQERLQTFREVETVLQGIPDFDQLRAGLVRLHDASTEATGLQRKAGTHWHARCRMLSDLPAITRHLTEGLTLFPKNRFTNLFDLMTQDQQATQQAQVLAARLDETEVSAGEWPAWLETEGVLVNLDAALTVLERSWPVLKMRGATWRAQLLGYLEAYLTAQVQEAKASSRARRFQTAQAILQKSWTLIPKDLRVELPADLQQSYASLWTSLKGRDGREDASTQFKQLARRVVRGDAWASVAEAARRVAIPSHPDVPVDDLQAWREAFIQGAAFEDALHKSPASNEYAALFQARLDLSKQTVLELPAWDDEPGLSTSVGQELRALHQQLQTSLPDLARQLQEGLQAETERLTARPEEDAASFLTLYWQTRWVRVAYVRATLTAALQQALEAWQPLAQTLLTHLHRLTSLDGLARAEAQAGRLYTFLEGLQICPATLRLPPLSDPDDFGLPAGVPSPRQAAQLTKALQTIQSLSARETAPNLDQAEAFLNEVHTTLQTLQRERETLRLDTPLSTDSAIQQVQTLLTTHVFPLIQALETAQAQKPFAAYKTLLEANAAREALKTVAWDWMLAPGLDPVRATYDQRRKARHAELQTQAAGYLQTANTAAKKLADDMLVPAGQTADTHTLREEVSAAILAAANQVSGFSAEDRVAKRKGARGKSEPVWKAVYAAATAHAGVQEWDALAAHAQEQLDALKQLPRWVLPVTAFTILVIILFAWAAIKLNSQQAAGQIAAQQTMSAQTAQIADTALANEQATATAARATVNVERAGTAEALAQATQTAQSVTTTAIFDQQTAVVQTATAQAAATTAQSLALTQAAASGEKCASASAYTFMFVPDGPDSNTYTPTPGVTLEPVLTPEPGSVTLIKDQYITSATRAFATWTLKIIETTVACPWKTLTLSTGDGEELTLEGFYVTRLDRDNAVITPLPTAKPAADATPTSAEIVFPEDDPLVVGETIKITIGFNLPPKKIDNNWVLKVNGVVLFDPEYRLKLKVDDWIIVLNPPTQTPKPTKETAPSDSSKRTPSPSP